ncbi:(2Fe-2S)-binding protein [Myxococcota bacterium]|nr:(2Fe-2S)-binding protein [Myxococcota bacterium]
MPKITFLPTRLSATPITLEIPKGANLMEAATDAGLPMGDACGGNCACASCHVYIIKGFDSLNTLEDQEDDVLGFAEDIREESRLACQVIVGAEDLTVEITDESQVAFANEHPEHREQISPR